MKRTALVYTNSGLKVISDYFGEKKKTFGDPVHYREKELIKFSMELFKKHEFLDTLSSKGYHYFIQNKRQEFTELEIFLDEIREFKGSRLKEKMAAQIAGFIEHWYGVHKEYRINKNNKKTSNDAP